MTSIVLPFSPRVSVFDWDYDDGEGGGDEQAGRVGVIYAAVVEQRQLIVRKFRPQQSTEPQTDAASVDEFRTVRMVYIRQLGNTFITSVVHSWLSGCGHFLLNCRVNASGTFRSGLLVFDSQLGLVNTMYFGLATFPCYCYADRLFYLPGEAENCIKLLRVPDLQVVSVLDCNENGHRYVPQEAKSPFQVSVSSSRILLCSFYTVSRRVVLNAYTKDPFQLQAEIRLDFSPMRYVDSGSEIIWFEGGPQQDRVKIRYVTIDRGFFVSDQEDSLSLLVPSRFTVPWLGSIWLFACRRGDLFALECPNFDQPGTAAAHFGSGWRGSSDCQLCSSIDLHRERKSLFSQQLLRDLVGRFERDTAGGESRLFVVYHDRRPASSAAD